MSEELLRAAQHGLRVDDIALRESQTCLADTYEPKYEAGPSNIQHYCAVRSSQLIELSNGGAVQHRKIFRVFVGLGVRWVRPPEAQPDQVRDGDEAPIVPSVLPSIEATFVAECAVADDLTQGGLNDSALYNAP